MPRSDQEDLEFEALRKWIWLMPAGWVLISAVIIALTYMVGDPEYTRAAPAKIAGTFIWLVGIWGLFKARGWHERRVEKITDRPAPRELRLRHGLAFLMSLIALLGLVSVPFWIGRYARRSPPTLWVIGSLVPVGIPWLLILRSLLIAGSTPAKGRRYSPEVAHRALRLYAALTIAVCVGAAVALLFLPDMWVIGALIALTLILWGHYLGSEHSEPAEL